MPLAEPSDEPIRIGGPSDGFELVWVENIAVVAWKGEATSIAVETFYKAVDERRKQFPKGVSFIHVTRAQSSAMSSEVRDQFVRGLKAIRGNVVATAVVAPANGFWASALRSIATGVMVLSRVSVETRFHDRVEEVLAWLPDKHEQVSGADVDRERLQRVLNKAHALTVAQAAR